MRTIEHKYIVATMYAAILFLDKLDLSIVNIALPTIAKHFHVLVTETQWVNNGFLIALSLSLPISAWMSGRYGSKRVFIYATAAFGLSAVLCALAPNLSFLVSMRSIQGWSIGLLVPIGMTMIFRIFDPSEYARISSYIFIPSLIAPALGPMLGGLMVHYLNWRGIFLCATPICVIIISYAYSVLKEHRLPNKLPLDSRGFVYFGGALLLIFHVFSELGIHLPIWRMGIELILALVLGYLFVCQEATCAAPLIHLDLFRKKWFVHISLIQICFQISHLGSLFIIAIYLQMNVGYSGMLPEMMMSTQALGAICSSRFSVKLFERYSATLPISLGFIGIGITTLLILCLDPTRPIWLGLGILFVRGLMSGLCGAPIQAISIAEVSKEQMDQAAATFNIMRQLALSLGIALTALLLNMGIRAYDSSWLLNQHKLVFYSPFVLISFSAWCGVWIIMRINKASLMMNRK